MQSSNHSTGFSISGSLIALAIGATFLTSVPASEARGFNLFDNPDFCSAWFANHGERSLPGPWKRQCLIAITTTYVDGEANFIAPEDMLLADDVVRYTVGNPRPEADPGNAEAIRQGIRDGATAVIADWGNPQWTVDLLTNQVFLIWDGYFVGSPDEPGFFVSERFSIERGLIREVLIGGVQFAPECEFGGDCS